MREDGALEFLSKAFQAFHFWLIKAYQVKQSSLISGYASAVILYHKLLCQAE